MRLAWPRLLAIVAFVLGLGLWVLRCSGPEPTVIGAPMLTAPAAPGDSYRVQATIANRGPGHGQADVIFRLRNRQSGVRYEETKQVMLDQGETVDIVAEFAAPDGDYEPAVEVNYPPG